MKKKKKKNNKKKTNSKKRLVIFFIIAIIIVIAILIMYVNKTEASLCLKNYFECLNNKDYEGMYNYINTDLSKEDFINRVKNIYEGIEAENIKATVITNFNKEDSENVVNITYNNSMDTIAGGANFVNNVKVKKIDGEYKILWNSSVIFSDLKDDYKIRVESLESTRGAIYDKNGIALAKDGTVYSVGLVSGKVDSTTNLGELASLLGITKSEIEKALNAEYVSEGTFVPLKKISKDEQELKNKLLKIKGILIDDAKCRVYPYKEVTSILTGYVQEGDGKTGLEYAYNNRLKGTDGKEIYIADSDGKKVKTLIKKNMKDGENINTTIDIELQKEIYNQFKNDKSASVAINYNTGEILSLVSTPTYDANDFAVGITQEEWTKLENDENKPMYNRYLGAYAPGSSLKPVVGAIGLKNNIFSGEDDFEKSGKKWQKDETWGDSYVTTLETYEGTSNLKNALIYSDNIYFAKAALKIGKRDLQSGLDDFGFNDKISFVQDISKSTYGLMESDLGLANSGYGQDKVMVNPIHLAMIYSSFANGGNMINPCLEYTETTYYKENVISSEIANEIRQDLVQVVEEGTGKLAKVSGKTIAGKTGTAEIKENQEDKNGTEIGWFSSFDENKLLIVSMVEDTKERGGSHYLLPKIKYVYESQK